MSVSADIGRNIWMCPQAGLVARAANTADVGALTREQIQNVYDVLEQAA